MELHDGLLERFLGVKYKCYRKEHNATGSAATTTVEIDQEDNEAWQLLALVVEVPDTADNNQVYAQMKYATDDEVWESTSNQFLVGHHILFPLDNRVVEKRFRFNLNVTLLPGNVNKVIFNLHYKIWPKNMLMWLLEPLKREGIVQ